MIFREVFLELIEGKKIRGKEWCENEYVYLDGLEILNHLDEEATDFNNFVLLLIELKDNKDEWELYEESIKYFGWQKAYEMLKEGKKLCYRLMNHQLVLYVTLCDNRLKLAYRDCKIRDLDLDLRGEYIRIFTEEPLWYEYKEK